MDIIVGIDLGTSNSSICYYKNGKLNVILDDNRYNISSIIGFTKYGMIFGNNVKKLTDNNIFIANIKRLIGLKYSDLSSDYISNFQYNIIDHNDEIKINISDTIYSIDEMMINFLSFLKQLISTEVKDEYKIILTVPAFFTIKQKETIKMCADAAGFNCLKLINEPTAAAIGYSNVMNFKTDDNLMVIDMGGGTVDFSLLTVDIDDDDKMYEVQYVYGANFGGSDLTHNIIDFLKNKVISELDDSDDTCDNGHNKIEYVNSIFSNKNLFEYIDKMKINISSGCEIDTININNYNLTLTNKEFDKLVDEWLIKMTDFLDHIFNDSDFKKKDIDNIVLVGGSSKLNGLVNKLNDYFNKENTQIVAGKFIDNYPMQDIAVSFGAALHGYINNTCKDLLLVDVCPFTIGIETIDNMMAPVIRANTKIPVSANKKFTTTENDMDEVTIKIYQGESKFCNNNIYLGEFVLKDIKKGDKGVPVINVVVTIDNNGLLVVTAFDRGNFSQNQITISAKDYKVDDKHIDKIKNNMVKNREKENKIFTMIETYNTCMLNYEHLIYNLVENAAINLEDDVLEDIKKTIFDNVNKIYSLLHYKEIHEVFKFNKFVECTRELFEDIAIDQKYDTKDIIQSLEQSFKNLTKLLKDKYSNLLIQLNNDAKNEDIPSGTSASQTKEEIICKLDDDNIKKDKIKLSTNILSTKLSDIDNINELTEEEKLINEMELKKYEYFNLANGLLENLDNLPLDDEQKGELFNYICTQHDIADGLNKECSSIEFMEDIIRHTNTYNQIMTNINLFCEELSNKNK